MIGAIPNKFSMKLFMRMWNEETEKKKDPKTYKVLDGGRDKDIRLIK